MKYFHLVTYSEAVQRIHLNDMSQIHESIHSKDGLRMGSKDQL